MGTLYDYNIIELLHTSDRSLIYRASSAQENIPVIVKILNRDSPSLREIAQFKRQYAIARSCDHDGIVRPLAVLQDGGYWTIIQEDIHGQSLNKLLLEKKSQCSEFGSQPAIALGDFFDIALQLCSALEVIRRHSIIHKDINPSNLIWNSEQRRLQLIDFGIACELGQETQEICHPNILEGTLHYMAPEQTGRMNRFVDYRADYYAVGATFYELLTGQTPFATADAMGLVHCHIARAPDWTLAVFDGIPKLLLEVLQRLMEKNAEQRYQTEAALRKDLELCRMLVDQPALVPDLSTRLFDHRGTLLIAQKLVGREREIETLLATFERTASGPSELLLVTGYSGIGKTAVINEVHKAIVARRGCFVSGKFDQYRRDVPYASLLQAFGALIQQLLCEPQEQLAQWAHKLRSSLGPNIGVMVELMPALALIIGATAPVAVLPPVESQHRLNGLFQRFVEVFCTAQHPLVLFLDDLQWADLPTLRMIELFMRDPTGCHLLLIGAYRDNEVDAAHPLMGLCDRLQRAGARLGKLVLDPLTEAQVAQLNADTLSVSVFDCAALTRLCYQKTRGNPFFLNQFLHAIHEAGHLRFQFDQRVWCWNMDTLESADYTDNVVDLMLEKIRCLPPTTQHLLQLAASIGNRFELGTLAIVTEKSHYQTQQDLWAALKAGLIHPLGQHYKYLDVEEGVAQISYRFLHDRVQQAAYVLASKYEREKNHLNIGRSLYRYASPEVLEKQLFSIVEQLNAGRTLIDNPEERLQLACLNKQAGLKARSAAAFQAAQHHLHIGIALLPMDAWTAHADLILDLQLSAAEASYLCGDFAIAEAIYPVVLAHCVGPLQKIRCIVAQSHQYQLQGRLLDVIDILRHGLSLLNIPLPQETKALEADTAGIFSETEQLCAKLTIEDLLEARQMCDPTSLAAMELMQGLWIASYYAGQQELSLAMVMAMTRLSLKHGNSDFTSVAYVAYAFFLKHSKNDVRSYEYGAMALTLANRRTNLQARTLTCLMFAALINHWTRPLRSSDAHYNDAFNCALDSSDFVNVGIVAAVRATDRLIMGHYLPDLLEATQRDLLVMRGTGQIDLVDCTIAGALQPIKCLMGLTLSNDSYDDADFSESRFMANHGSSRLYQAYFFQGKIRNAYFFDCSDAENLVSELDIVVQILRGQAKVAETTFYATLIWIRILQRDPQRLDAPRILERIESLQQNLARWAKQCPANLAVKYLLTQAEMARYRQDMSLAAHCYQQAMDAARETNDGHLRALSNELCGEFWLEQGLQHVAQILLRDAVLYYRQWGAQGKVVQLSSRHANLIGAAHGHAVSSQRQQTLGTSNEGRSTSTGSSTNATLDLASIVEASLALSNEIGLRNVLQRLMTLVRDNSGAQIARLLLFNDGYWHLEADIIGDTIECRQAQQISVDAEDHPQFPLSLLRYVIRTGTEIIEDNLASSVRFAADGYILAQQPRSVLCLPIKQAGRVGGILYLENNLVDGCFTTERAEFLRIVGAQAMISISHALLHDSLEQRVAQRTAQLEDANGKLITLSTTDGLTGLANRRHFDAVLISELARSRRSRQPLTLIMIDVDYFKKYNDCKGHQAGDQCLIVVALALRACAGRASDLSARYGGEEFSIVLPNTNATVARSLAESMRHAIELLEIPHPQAPLGKITISVGVAISHAGTSEAQDLVRAADEALYRAKDAGRNCVV